MAKNQHTFPRFDLFRETVDVVQGLPGLANGLYSNNQDAFSAIEQIFKDCEKPELLLQPLNGEIADEFGQISKEVIIANRVRGDVLEPYLSIAHVLRDSLRDTGNVATITRRDARWIEAIRIALAHVVNRDPKRHVPRIPDPKDVTFGDAIEFFAKNGVQVTLVGDEIGLLPASTWEMIADSVWYPIKSLGDTQAMRLIDDLLRRRYDIFVERVRMHATPALMSEMMERSLPFGHLYRLALRSLGRKRTTTSIKVACDRAQKAAIHLGALYDVEPFNAYASMFPPYQHRIIEALLDIVRFDELFSVPQCRSQVMDALLKDLFGDFQIRDTDRVWSVPDALILWSLLLQFSRENSDSSFVDEGTFRDQLRGRVGRIAADAMLACFVLRSPNSAYRLPGDAHSADTRECAIAEASGNRLWLAPRPFLGPAFLSRLLSQLTKIDVDASSRIGRAFENRMYERLKALGMRCRRGDLGTKGAKSGDADLIVETGEVVALFEFKKKALTRRTNAGNDLQLVVDLAKGLIAGVNQLAKQEIELRRTGKLRFTDGSELHLDGRRIIKIVVSLSDHGGLHDAATVRHMLGIVQNIELSLNREVSAEHSAQISAVNKIFGTLRRRSLDFAELVNIDEEGDLFDGLLFHNIYFVEQLLLKERTGEKFLNALLVGQRLVTGTRDPFFDYAHFHG